MSDFVDRPTWVDVDVDAFRHNLEQARKFCSLRQRLLAVIKADAYGHGALKLGLALQRWGIKDFAVATLGEAVALREAGVAGSLLVLGGCFPGQEETFIDFQLQPALLDVDTAERLNRAGRKRNCQVEVHLKVDSGMGRVGFRTKQLASFLPQLRGLTHLNIVGFMSHLACADDLDSVVTDQQYANFKDMLEMVRSAGISPRDIHLGNSAGLTGWELTECTMFRPGIMLYGGLPGPEFADRLDLKPVMHLRTRIAQLRSLPGGTAISYGHTFVANSNIEVAVLPIGYADGYNRLFSNCGRAIVRGQEVRIVGRVCMDWIMIDVTSVSDVAVGDCVTLLGEADGLSILGDEWAQQLDTISYEVFCRIGSRVPRRYLES